MSSPFSALEVDLVRATEEDRRDEGGGMAKGGRGAPGPRAATLTIPRSAGFNFVVRFSRGAEEDVAGPGFSSEGFSRKTVDRFAIPEEGAEGAGVGGEEVTFGEMALVVARREM